MGKILNVYLHDILAGNMVQNIHGRLEFQYQSEYLDRLSPMPLSQSLPLSEKMYNDNSCRPFFSGLLPDEEMRKRVARNLGVSAQNPFALLYQIGRECAGAVILCPPKEIITEQGEKFHLYKSKLIEVLKELETKPLLAGNSRVKLSLAGAQNKLAVFYEGGQYYLVKKQPTTHILKPTIVHYQSSVYNELFCMRLAKQVGLNVAEVSLELINDNAYLLIKRYDRHWDGNSLIRRHQEDFCQALGILPEIKYENEGGPSASQCMELIDRSSNQPAVDKLHFLRSIIFNYLVANADAHAKNFSLLYDQKIIGKSKTITRLSPLYDILCTAVYPELDTKMAMKIGKRYKPSELQLRHWHRLVADTATARTQLDNELKMMMQKVVTAIPIVKNELLSERATSPIYDKITIKIGERVHRLRAILDIRS